MRILMLRQSMDGYGRLPLKLKRNVVNMDLFRKLTLSHIARIQVFSLELTYEGYSRPSNVK